MTTITSIQDLRELARRRVPTMFYDYVDAGSWTESTYKANEAYLQLLEFRQRVAVNIESRSLRTSMIGQNVRMPVALAPTGLTGMLAADGEILAARAAATFGVPFTLSTMSICSIEDVAQHASTPFWFQLYVMRERGFIAQLIERAKAAGCSALMLTLDLQVQGQRHKDIRNGLTAPPKLTLRNLVDMALKPRWSSNMLRASRRTFGNIVGHAKGVSDLSSLASWSSEQFDPTLSWNDVEWIKQRWGGPLIVKGILDEDDARSAVAAGADAIVVSNHGGRQLDGAPPTAKALPSIVSAVGNQSEVWVDGGIRSGQDVLKMLALGAKATLIGRAFLYGLAAMGEDGVRKSLEIIHDELDRTMAFCGHTDIRSVNRKILWNDSHRCQHEHPLFLQSA